MDLPASRFAQFEREQKVVMEEEILEEPIHAKDYIVHSTIASVLLGLPVSEASVERAFLRHNLVHFVYEQI